MNKISRLFLVFLLTILTVFAVSACTKKEDNQDNKTTMTEEAGIPLETYLNGNFNYTEEAPFAKETKIRQKNMPHFTLTPQLFLSEAKKTKKAINNLNYSKNSHIGKLDSAIYSNHPSVFFARVITNNMAAGPSSVWAGGSVDYSISYYKNGINVYTKNINTSGSKPALFKEWEYELTFNEFKKIYYQGEGLYVIHIKQMIAGGYYKKEKYENCFFFFFIIAFQIGDGDDVG